MKEYLVDKLDRCKEQVYRVHSVGQGYLIENLVEDHCDPPLVHILPQSNPPTSAIEQKNNAQSIRPITTVHGERAQIDSVHQGSLSRPLVVLFRVEGSVS